MIESRFGDVNDETGDALHAGASLGFGDVFGVGCDNVLGSQRILIIAEAGAGKSHKCRAQQRRLWGQGKAVFYLDLNELATAGVTGCLDPDDRGRFAAWR